MSNFSNSVLKAFHILFALILLAELLAILHISSMQLINVALVGVFFLSTLLSSFWGVFLFTTTIPLVNGWFVSQGIANVSLAFTGVFLAWSLKQLFTKKYIKAITLPGFFAYVLIVVVLLNLGLVFARSTEFATVSRFWLEWYSYVPFIGQGDKMWQVNAALLFLKGLFLFRIISVELYSNKRWLLFTKVVYVQGIIIVCFSAYQLASYKIQDINYSGISLPFDDIHSYGSVVVLLFLVFLCLLKRNIENRLMHKTGSSPILINGLFSVLFFLLCLYSSSRATWLVMVSVVALFLFLSIRNKKLIGTFFLMFVVMITTVSIFIPRLFQSNNSALNKFESLLDVKKIAEDRDLRARFQMWDRSLRMVKDYPLTGIGIGNYYRHSYIYRDPLLPVDSNFLRVENSHNYYLQVAAELGFPGVILFLLLLLSLLLPPPGVNSGNDRNSLSNPYVVPYSFGIGAYLLTLLTGHALLLISQQFMFWSTAAILSSGRTLSSTEKPVFLSVSSKVLKKIGIVVLTLYFIGFFLNIYKKSPWTIPSGYGFYSMEYWNGKKTRWMCGKSEYYLPAGSAKLQLEVIAQAVNSKAPDGLNCTISLNDAVVDTLHFIDGGSKIVNYNLASINQERIKVSFDADKVFCPRRIGLSSDPRVLGVAVHVIE